MPTPASLSPTEINHLGMLFNTGRYAELESRVRPLVGKYPASGVAWKLLGLALLMQGKEALPALKKTVQLLPNDAEALSNLAGGLRDAGQLEEAAAICRRAIQIKPHYAEAYNNLGAALKDLGQYDEAVASYSRAIALKPAFASAHNNLGVALQALNKFDEAVACFRRTLEINPNFVEAHNNLGGILGEFGQLNEAIVSYRRALAFTPGYAEAHSNLGNALKDAGQYDDAVISYRHALELKPDLAEARSNLLFSLNYMADYTPAAYLAEARLYGQMVTQKATTPFSVWSCVKQPARLRVGLVSGDLNSHPVGYFLESLLSHIDPARIELIAYSTQIREDALTARIKPYFAAWKSLVGLSDQAAAQLIHTDGVHVLLDLAGHSAFNRLPVFAWKPAPVQTAWLGYFATTGVAEMDYLIADQIGVPEAHRMRFTESIWYLPDTRLCFSAPPFDVPVAPLPAQHNGHVTFGSFQNLAKVGEAVLTTWARVLASVPGSRLRWQV